MAITYTPTTNFGAKDSLPTNDPDKVIKGSEFTTEFTAIQTAFSLAAPNASPTFTGTVTIPTADINGGNIDGTVIGGASAAAGTFTNLTASGTVSFSGATVSNGGTVTTVDINGGNIDGTVIGAATPAAGSFTTFTSNGIDDNASATAVTLDASGNVGIGTASPDAQGGNQSTILNLEGSDNLVYFSGGSGGNAIDDGLAIEGVATGVSSGDKRTGSILMTRANTSTTSLDSKIAFYTTSSGTHAERMRIDSAGNVGIGTSSPAAALHASETASGLTARFSNESNQTLDIGTVAGAGSSGSVYFDNPNSGNIQFRTGGSERMRIGSTGGVSIGNTVDLGAKSLNVGTASGVTVGDFVGQVNFQGYTSTYGAGIKSYVPSGVPGIDYQDLRFHTSAGPSAINVERMRLTSTGYLLVGTTDDAPGAGNTNAGVAIRGGSDNRSFFSVSSNYVAAFNRNTNDGNIVEFNKDGTTVGSIGSHSGIYTYIGTDDTALLFAGNIDAVIPFSPSASNYRDNAIDVGTSSYRFKDLYLSGGVYLGGTGAANLLDDYEEGTWTPAFGYSGGNGTGSWSYNILEGNYTKIGRTVYFRVELRFSVFIKGSASGSPLISGLPFTSGGITNGEHYAVNLHTYNTPLPTTAGTFPALQVGAVSTAINLYTIVNDAAYGSMPDPDNNSEYKIAGWYTVA